MAGLAEAAVCGIGKQYKRPVQAVT
jgi:hypothetical protein